MKHYKKIFILAVIVITAFAFINTVNTSAPPLAGKPDTTETDFGGFFKAGSQPGLYEIGISTEKYNNMPVYYVQSTDDVIYGFGTIMKQLRADEYLSKRIKLSGNIKCDRVVKSAGMWFRVDGYSPGVMLGFDNMGNRPIDGTSDWQKYEIVLDVPDTSAALAYGVLLTGNGTVWLSGLSFEAVDNDVPVTNMLQEPVKGSTNEVAKELPTELKNIPDGIEVSHTPVNVNAVKTKDDTTMLYWFHETTVKALKEDIEITEFGSYSWVNDHWEFGNLGGTPFSPKDFAEWYQCKNAKLKKGKVYSDKNNWSRWPYLQRSTAIWYYIGKNKKGELFKGTAIVNYLPVMKK